MEAERFKILVTGAYGPMMRQALAMLRDPDRAKDVVQEVTVRLWQSPQGLEASRNPEAYCVRCVHNAAVSALRGTASLSPLDEAREVESLPEGGDEQDYLRALLARLPEMQRRVFVMRQSRDMEYDEIAEVLDTSPANVRQLLSRARKTLRTLYSQTI